MIRSFGFGPAHVAAVLLLALSPQVRVLANVSTPLPHVLAENRSLATAGQPAPA
jgi:hypothetical protein